MRLEISARARKDIDLIFIYGIENFGEARAQDYSSELLDLFDLIILQPKMGIEKSGFKKPLRAMLFYSHIVFYRLGRGKVRILRILHGKQNQPVEL